MGEHTNHVTGAGPAVSDFDRATAVTRREGHDALYDATLDDAWRIGGGINGGLLLAVAARALGHELGDTSGHSDPFAVTAYYLSATRPGPATVHTEILRRGNSLSTAAARLSQPDEAGRDVERLRVLAAFGDLDGLTADVRTSAVPPRLPGPDDCVRADQASPAFLERAPIIRSLDLRLDPATIGWAAGRPSGEGRISGWLRMPDGRQPDPLLLMLAVDALPPVTFDLGIFGWVPTIELTVHIRARPAPGWLRVSHATRNFAGGFVEEDAEVWDENNRLVAQSRQFARVPTS